MTYEEILIIEWNLRVQTYEQIDSLEELDYLKDEVKIIYDTLDYEFETYVKSQKSLDKLMIDVNKVADCFNKKTKEFN